MSNSDSNIGDKLAFILTYILTPLMFIGFGVYFYFGIGSRNKVSKTIDDIVVITKKVSESYLDRKYKQFNTDTVVLGNYLPYDIEPEMDGQHYVIPNRFGGQMFIFETVANIRERTLFFGLYNQPERYQQVYSGVSSYVIMLTGINRKACRILAQTNWAGKIPNFMGLEAAYVNAESPNNGVYNLSNYVLTDNEGEQIKTIDQGIVARGPLSKANAKKACQCLWRGCTFAIKFK